MVDGQAAKEAIGLRAERSVRCALFRTLLGQIAEISINAARSSRTLYEGGG